MKTLNGKAAIISGAGSGMGKAMALLFATEGAKILVSDIKQERVDSTVNEIKANNGIAIGCVANVWIESDIKLMVDTCIKEFGSLDILVNNAGVMDNFAPVGDTTNELLNHVMGINFYGPFYACRLGVQQMIKQGKGVIVNTASVGGLMGCRAGAAYTASKHALVGLTKNIGFMYGSKGIRCNAIAPGAVNTNIMEG